jgi:hypothetical protein
MKRHSLLIVPALALAMAAPAMARDDEKEKNQNRMRREQIYGDRGGYYGDSQNMRFRGMDRNRDGIITRREWRGNDRSFRNQDLNRDGVLSGREVWSGSRSSIYDNRGIYDNRDVYDNGSIFGSRNNTATFGRLDRNNDGVLEAREWPYGSSAFLRLDRNGNRVIENWEYRMQ